MSQSWIILCKEGLDELGKYLGLRDFWEEVGKDAPKRIPRRRQALACQIAIQLKNGESVQDTIFIQFLVPGVVLTHLPY
jgi:1,2-phenylacetyl-CoA epoxidase catalytic subunit